MTQVLCRAWTPQHACGVSSGNERPACFASSHGCPRGAFSSRGKTAVFLLSRHKKTLLTSCRANLPTPCCLRSVARLYTLTTLIVRFPRWEALVLFPECVSDIFLCRLYSSFLFSDIRASPIGSAARWRFVVKKVGASFRRKIQKAKHFLLRIS